IIIDTPPIGLVTDAYLLMKHSNVNIFVTRQNFTIKKVFESIISDVEKRGLNNIAILVNDVKYDNNRYGYSYGNYGYGYGYGYGYYTDDDTHDLEKRKKKRTHKVTVS
ncbi:MAG: hypothetical protein WCQ70_12130, partial [Lentimicrobiaceae bacterium]